MAKKLDEKLKEAHELKNRIIIWYVRAYLIESSLKEKYEKAKRSLDNWESQLSDTDKYIANLIINGANVDSINEFQKEIYRKDCGFVPYWLKL